MIFSHDICDLLKLHVLYNPILLDDCLVSRPLVIHFGLGVRVRLEGKRSCKTKLKVKRGADRRLNTGRN